jgi:hypothetical protein
VACGGHSKSPLLGWGEKLLLLLPTSCTRGVLLLLLPSILGKKVIIDKKI